MKPNFILSIFISINLIVTYLSAPFSSMFATSDVPIEVYFWGYALMALLWFIFAMVELGMSKIYHSPIFCFLTSFYLFFNLLIPYQVNFYHQVNLILAIISLIFTTLLTFIPMKVSES
jgi:hypothetical protein